MRENRLLGVGVGESYAFVFTNDALNEPLPKTMPPGELIRFGVNQDLVAAIYLLCQPESNYISGETLVCSGGFMM